MNNDKINYSEKKYPERFPIAFDFSGESSEGKIISFQAVDRDVRPIKERVQMGSFIPEKELQQILKKDRKDQGYFKAFESMFKNDKELIEINETISLLRDFFPEQIVSEVGEFIVHILPKVKGKLSETCTPRKRRTIILAVFLSICRKNARKISPELLEEINDRFNYQKRIKLKEIFQWEARLIQWNLLSRSEDLTKNRLKNFFLQVVNLSMRLEQDPIFVENNAYQEILKLTKMHLTNYLKNDKQKKALEKFLKHSEVDFVVRLMFWTIAKYFAFEKFNLEFKKPDEVAGWRTIFLADINSEEIPIRSWKYIFWREFGFRNELKESSLFPAF